VEGEVARPAGDLALLDVRLVVILAVIRVDVVLLKHAKRTLLIDVGRPDRHGDRIDRDVHHECVEDLDGRGKRVERNDGKACGSDGCRLEEAGRNTVANRKALDCSGEGVWTMSASARR
jgi:hypothetical protein